MKSYRKPFTVSLICLLLLVSLTGCSVFQGKSTKYAQYVTSLLDANYKGEFETFLSMTDSDAEAVSAAYEEGISHLADTLIAYYGIELVDDGTIHNQFVELTRQIYAASKYEVQPAVKSGDTYTVEVLIYPMDILQTTYDDVIAYIRSFNEKKDAGEFDDYEIEQYEVAYAQGILDILTTAIPNISYQEASSTIVTIQTEENLYSISQDDFTKLDHNLIASVEDTSESMTSTATEQTSESKPGIDDVE